MSNWGTADFAGATDSSTIDMRFTTAEVASKKIVFNLNTVVVPTQIVDIRRHVNDEEEKIMFNNTIFSMNQLKTAIFCFVFFPIRTVGIVEKATEREGGQVVEYVIGDMKDLSSFIIVLHYREVNSSETCSLFPEQTVVFITGKLGSFENGFAVIAFEIKEVDDLQELEALQLEAKLAKLFYMKEIMQKILKNPSVFENTMLRGNYKSSNRIRKLQTPNNLKNDLDTRNQIPRICNYLANLDKSVGATIDEIIQMIPKSIFNARTFFADIDILRCNGFIATTIDGNHFIANC
uniref:RPA_C domain-containing protein n=1 Tax=Syphacia muris TaxID=451379 RepID=A0A0N5AL48_9BILA